MNKKLSLTVIVGILVLTGGAYWLTGADAPLILAGGLFALCAFLLADTIYDVARNRPESGKKKRQALLTIAGSAALCVCLLYLFAAGKLS